MTRAASVVLSLILTVWADDVFDSSTQPDVRRALQFSSRAHNARCTDCAKLGDTIRKLHKEELQKSDDVSFEAWVKVTPWPTKTHGVEGMGWAFMHAGPCSYNQCAFLGFRHDGAVLFGFILDDLVSSPSFLEDENKWVHWTATFRVSTRERILYRNGEEVARDTSKPAGYEPHSNDLTIGSDNWSNHPFPGLVDEVRVWRKVVLTPPVIKAFMCARSLADHPHADSLVVRYTFDDSDAPSTDGTLEYQSLPLVAEEGGPLPGGGEPGFDLEQCMAACNETPKCRSFSFSEEVGACYLKDKCLGPSPRLNSLPSAKNYLTYGRKCQGSQSENVGLDDFTVTRATHGRPVAITDGVKIVEGRRDDECPLLPEELKNALSSIKQEPQPEPTQPSSDIPVDAPSAPEPAAPEPAVAPVFEPKQEPEIPAPAPALDWLPLGEERKYEKPIPAEPLPPVDPTPPPDLSEFAVFLVIALAVLSACCVGVSRLRAVALRRRAARLRDTPLPLRSTSHHDD